MDEVGRDRYDGDLLGADPHAALAELFALARAAARDVTDRETTVHCSFGDVPVWDYFWQLNVARTLCAHDIARHLGAESPLTEELARQMWEGTAPAADTWRSFGIYRQEVPVPTGAGWRARYLALTGRPLDRSRIQALEADGLIAQPGRGRLAVTPAGFPVLDAVVADLAA